MEAFPQNDTYRIETLDRHTNRFDPQWARNRTRSAIKKGPERKFSGPWTLLFPAQSFLRNAEAFLEGVNARQKT